MTVINRSNQAVCSDCGHKLPDFDRHICPPYLGDPIALATANLASLAEQRREGSLAARVRLAIASRRSDPERSQGAAK